MSTILDILRASGGSDVEIPTLELTCPAWANSMFICGGFFDVTATLEDARVVTFTAAGLDASLPKNSNDGAQKLGIAVDNVRGDAQSLVDQANAAGEAITIIYRVFLESDLTAPAEAPLILDTLQVEMDGPTVSFTGGYFNLISTAWPRFRYTTDFAPGIKYIA